MDVRVTLIMVAVVIIVVTVGMILVIVPEPLNQGLSLPMPAKRAVGTKWSPLKLLVIVGHPAPSPSRRQLKIALPLRADPEGLFFAS